MCKVYLSRQTLNFLFLLISLSLFSQDDTFFNPGNTLGDVPQTPEVAAFEKFTASVNMYTGVPTISIPLYTLQGKEMSLPISLSYDASGIKVDQIATTVGLGWNLNYGGVVTRKVNGHIDDAIDADRKPQYPITLRGHILYLMDKENMHGQHDSQADASAAKLAYNRYEVNELDLQPDTFSFSALGLSGTIFIDYDDLIDPITTRYAAYCLEDPSIKVEYYVNDKFIVRNTDGTTFTFAEKEISRQTYSGTDQTSNEYMDAKAVDAWHLSKIESANGIDVFDFTYNTFIWADNEIRTPLQYIEIKPSNPNFCNLNLQTEPIRDLSLNEYKKEHIILQSINHSMGGTLKTRVETTLSSADRDDLEGVKKIEVLTVYNEIAAGPSGNELLIVDFDNDTYFGTGATQTGKRLKLDGIKLYRDDILKAKKHVFDYISPESVPDRKSFSVDFWGYFNGKVNLSLAVDSRIDCSDLANYFSEHTTAMGFNHNSGGTTPANRRPDFDKTQIGTLRSIVFPTGGKSTYYYEKHLIKIGSNLKEVGGLRLKSVKNENQDPIPGESDYLETYYFYNDTRCAFK